MRLSPKYFQDIAKMLDFYSQFNPSPISIKKFIDFGASAATLTHNEKSLAEQSPEVRESLDASEKKSFIFLRKELPVRLANIMKEIALLPENLLRMPSVVCVNDWYMKSFQDILEFEKKEPNESTLSHFCDQLVKIRNRHTDVVETMAQGVLELKESHDVENYMENSIQYFLDRFYMSRISIRMLINQHTLLFGGQLESAPGPNKSKFIGCIDTQCDLVSVVQDAYENAKFLCEQYYLNSPDINIDIAHHKELEKESGINIVYVPSHLYHMLFELFKNSMRAVMEYYGDSVSEYPPITLTVAKGREDICLKVSDKGGGIPRSVVDQLFKYMYSTAPQPSKSDAHTVPLAGYGYGLPISRLYARYFHGDLVLLSCEGHGTDAIIYMKALTNEANELLPIFNKTTSKFYKTAVQTGDWSNQATVIGDRQISTKTKTSQLQRQSNKESMTGAV